jgi:hypothetical protein
MGKSFHIGRLRSPEISMPIPPVYIVNDSDVIDDRGIMDIPDIVIADVHAGDTLPRTKGPIMRRRPVAGISNADVYPWTDRRPTIITTVFAPCDPCRSPFVTRYPHPSIRVIIEPVAIVEGGPTPTIIRDPCPSVGCIHPMTTCAVRSETGACARHPYITVIRVAHPGAERTKLIVEHLETDAGLGVCTLRKGRQAGCKKCYTRHYYIFFHIVGIIDKTSNTITMPDKIRFCKPAKAVKTL